MERKVSSGTQEDISVSKKKKNGVKTQTPLLAGQNKERQSQEGAVKSLCLRLLLRAVVSLRLVTPSARLETGFFLSLYSPPLFLPPFLSVTLLLRLKERRKYLSNLTQRWKLLQVQGLERDPPPPSYPISS